MMKQKTKKKHRKMKGRKKTRKRTSKKPDQLFVSSWLLQSETKCLVRHFVSCRSVGHLANVQQSLTCNSRVAHLPGDWQSGQDRSVARLPLKGGDVESFKSVNRVWQLLSDAEGIYLHHELAGEAGPQRAITRVARRG